MNNPLITVNIAAYNAEKYICDAVESVMKQSYQNLEIIVCDDSSTDSTFSILKDLQMRDTRIKVIQNETNQGYLKTFNRLLNEAAGSFITFVDADDFIACNKIELQYQFLVENPNIGVVGTQAISITENGKFINRTLYPKNNDEIVKMMRKEMCFCGSSVMVRKDIVVQVGGYRDFFIGCAAEDYDWIYRIMDITQLANLEYVGYYYRFHNQSFTRRVHFALKHRHIHDIVRFLAKEREEVGSDFIMRNDKETYNKLMRTIAIPYQEDKGLLYRKIIIEYAINKNQHITEMYFNRLLKLKGCSIQNLKVWIMMKMLICIDYSILTKIKRLTGLSHLSSRV